MSRNAIYDLLFQNDLTRTEHYLARTAPLVANPGHVMRGNWLMCQAWLAKLKGDTTKAWDLIQACFELRWVKGTAFAEVFCWKENKMPVEWSRSSWHVM